ncbi:GNAT family N-acetyltransferase [Romeria aff. gracilis LEGE 07310]|uniref:GNAT family N-acetyltransferase n=1 Tax=Vasconcelosia minhoensis LEGE 07310 TaxID=915328 RepID=A0A8J7DQT9_9CYAN|nr:GNAT family N-acetyltransferase [Romeria gracilis]MBE9077119.1 GNAT family N-acetyltransferase [Romeria aff. gracilis LEGE 07310]
MSESVSPNEPLTIRPIHYRDLDRLVPTEAPKASAASDPSAAPEMLFSEHAARSLGLAEYLQQVRRWYGPLKALNLFPPLQHLFSVFVAERQGQPQGMIQVSPFNRNRSTWQVDRVLVNPSASQAQPAELQLSLDVSSQLLRHCFEKIVEAHTWITETNIGDKFGLALYRHNGFQPLAQITYWSIKPEQLLPLAEPEPALPNLLPVSSADAQLLYQLETVSMPPLVRQVFDHQIQDFRSNPVSGLGQRLSHWLQRTEVLSNYVFEPQRKAAIGYFQLRVCRDGSAPHVAKLTVHPAYTWLYPELMAQMARAVQGFPAQALRLASADYQPEREEYLKQIGGVEVEHTLMMSRSVWHKVRESKSVSLEGLALPDVLPGLQPAGKPTPSHFSRSRQQPPAESSREATGASQR